MTPAQDYASVQLSPRTGAGRLPALSGHFIDIPLDQGATSEYNLNRALQVFQKTLQVLPRKLSGLRVSISVFLVCMLYILIAYRFRASQEKIDRLKKKDVQILVELCSVAEILITLPTV
jgi:hypothetical protein